MAVRKVANPAMTAVEQQMALLTKKRLLVGIPGDAGPQPGSAVPLWLLGYIHEFGADDRHIPARPFLLPGIQSVKEKIAAQLTKGAAAVLAGAPASEGAKGLHGAGLLAVHAVKAKFLDGSMTPLAPATIYRRQHRKKPPPNDRTTPLRDTGAMFQAILYAIKD